MDTKNKEKYAEMKQFIRIECESRVEALKKAAEDAISAISFLEDTFELADRQSTKAMTPPMQPSFPRLNKSNKRSNRGKGKKTARQRMDVALAALPDQFTRNQLKDKINKDGYKPIKEGTFAGQFSKLLKSGRVLVLQENVGNKAGTYGKHRDAGQAESSQLSFATSG